MHHYAHVEVIPFVADGTRVGDCYRPVCCELLEGGNPPRSGLRATAERRLAEHLADYHDGPPPPGPRQYSSGLGIDPLTPYPRGDYPHPTPS